MGLRVVRVSLGLAVAALAVTAGASSRPAAGITVTAQKPVVALLQVEQSSGFHTYAVAASARWSPEALHDEVQIDVAHSDGGVARVNGYDQGNALHSDATYRGFFGASAGERIVITAKWTVYTPEVSGRVEGKKTSSATVLIVPKQEPAPRLDEIAKARARGKADEAYAECLAVGGVTVVALALGVTAPVAAVLTVAAAFNCAVGLYFERVADDPVDLDFRSIAKPKIPAVPKVSAGEGLPTRAARAANDLFAIQAREIGLARAIATAFDRSQGAHVKKQTGWEKKQVRAAGTYAAQLARAILAEASQRPKVKAALADTALDVISITYEDAVAFGESLVWKGLPAQITATLARLDLTKAEQKDVRARSVVIDPGLYDGNVLNMIADPRQIGSLRKLAASLTAFAKKAAKDPLGTRPP